MRKFSVFIAAAFLLSWIGSAYAGRPPNTPDNYRLKKIGTVATGDADIANGGHDVAMIALACGGSACTGTLADANTDPAVAGDYGEDSAVVIEVGAAANATTIVDLTESPLTFSNGILFQDDANVAGVTVYEFR